MDQKEQKYIEIFGAKTHNLKNISIKIPKNKLVVITGVSGSGKSSLAFDTIYAEGQRRYIESMSSYARQFLGKIDKPNVEFIKNISPAIAIEQKVSSVNPRSTVGTTTEIYDYFKIFFTRIGKIISPISGEIVKRYNVEDVINKISKYNENAKVLIYSKLNILNIKDINFILQSIKKDGYNRVKLIEKEDFIQIDDFDKNNYKNKEINNIYVLIDRLIIRKEEEDYNSRIYEAIDHAFMYSDYECSIEIIDDKKEVLHFSDKLEQDGLKFIEPNEHLFSFNNPMGSCKKCDGFGISLGIDEDLVIPNKNLSIFEGAIACWKGEKMEEWKNKIIYSASKHKLPIHRPIKDFSKQEYDLLWNGNKSFLGIKDFFEEVNNNLYKIQYRIINSRYSSKIKCNACEGKRLTIEASYIKVDNYSILDFVDMPINKLISTFNELHLSEQELIITKRLREEITNRLQYLIDVGLTYLTLNRGANTLSGGETQRINLANAIGSSLIGSLYILDEPSIGLHSKDTHNLIKVLKNLRDVGNTVLIVEHDEDIMRNADEIIDIGPLAGEYGGELVFQGKISDLTKSNSITSMYLTNRKKIELPTIRKTANIFIEFEGCKENNLKNINVKIPLYLITAITGVSGSGKSSLVHKIIYPSIGKKIGHVGLKTGKFDNLNGDIKLIENIEYINQNPIGKSSRSNPATYVGLYNDIREIFASTKQAIEMGYKSGNFSFNTEGGRCPHCKGDGEICINMQFMADVYLECEECKGKRFIDEILEIKFRNKNIYDILNMPIGEALMFFETDEEENQRNVNLLKKAIKKLKVLNEVGLDYIKIGQSSNTLSGGEAQRIKLANYLINEKENKNNMFIFDEPTTGLHFNDIDNLMKSIYKLRDRGNTIILVEHNIDAIKCADYIIDLGPEGGEKGGNVLYQGEINGILKSKESFTAKYLRDKM